MAFKGKPPPAAYHPSRPAPPAPENHRPALKTGDFRTQHHSSGHFEVLGLLGTEFPAFLCHGEPGKRFNCKAKMTTCCLTPGVGVLGCLETLLAPAWEQHQRHPWPAGIHWELLDKISRAALGSTTGSHSLLPPQPWAPAPSWPSPPHRLQLPNNRGNLMSRQCSSSTSHSRTINEQELAGGGVSLSSLLD